MPASNSSDPPPPRMPEPDASRDSSSLVRLLPTEGAHPGSPDDQPTIIGPKIRGFPSPHVILNPGVRLGQYEIVEAIGSGGMATVLKARDTELGRDVALKILPPESARDPDAIARFKLEARSAAKLDHEFVARVFSCGEDRGLHFIAFEFVEGVTLRDEIDRLGTVPAADCVRYMGHLAAGLQHAADRGVVHRDVKPSNIIITPDGRAKIIDMGLARQMDLHAANGGVTQSGVTLGTFDYISPEQALDPRRADARSDIYSLGCAFYHALTGRPPVPEGTAARKLQAHQHEAPTDPRELNPAIPDDVAIVLSRMMMKDPARRYQSPMELIADLTAISATWKLPPTGSTVQPSHAMSERHIPSVLRTTELPKIPLSVVLGSLAMLLAIVFVYASLGGKPSPSPQQWGDLASATTKPAHSPEPTPSGSPPRTRPTNAGMTAKNVDDLIRAFDAQSVSLKLVPGHVYDLSATPGVLFRGKDLLLECTNPLNPATIRIAAVPARKPGELREGSLTVVKAESVKFHGVLIEVVENADGEEESKAAPNGLFIADGGTVEFSECRIELDPSATTAFGSGIHLVRSNRSPAMALTVKNCLFDVRRWAALELGEGLSATILESGFATAETAIRFGEDAEPPDLPVDLHLRHCTFLLENRAAAIDVRKGAGGTIDCGFCVFGSPVGDPNAMMTAEAGDRKPAVLRIADGAEAVAYSSEPEMPNAYFGVEVPTGAGEKDAELKQSPWATNPPQGKLTSAKPWKAFELNAAIPALRVAAPKDVYLMGVKRLPTADTKVYDEWPPGVSAVDAPPVGFKVWWPDPPAEKRGLLPAGGVYANLAEALAAVKRDDVLLIRGKGIIEVPYLPALGKPDLRLTIRPESETAVVVLVPAESTRADSSLFRLEDGELVLERLEFRLRPTVAEVGDMRSQAVVTVAGGRRCEFHQCAIGLDEQQAEKLAAVAIVDVAGIMRKPDASRPPLIRMENCILTGKGRAIWAANTIPCDLAIVNTIVALNGPVFNLDSPSKSAASGAVVNVNLTHITAFLNGPLFDIGHGQVGEEKAGIAIPVEVKAEGCLIVARGAAPAPLVRIAQARALPLDQFFNWHSVGANAYANWPSDAVLLQVSGDAETPDAARFDAPEWLAFTKEKAAATGTLKWKKTPSTHPKPQDFEPLESPWKDDMGAKRDAIPVPFRE